MRSGGASFLAGKLGEPIGAENINIIDDNTMLLPQAQADLAPHLLMAKVCRRSAMLLLRTACCGTTC